MHFTATPRVPPAFCEPTNVASFNLDKDTGAAGVAVWQPGLRYNYNVIVSLTGIQFLPSIRQWTTGTMETDLNQQTNP